VRRLEDELRRLEVKTGVHLMTSASGVATAEGAVARPVNLLMSGPVAGVVGGIWAGRQAGYDNVITLDVGGTSADIGLAQDGRLRMKHLLDTRVGPYQAMIPMVDVDTIGAGGGLDRVRRSGRHLPRRTALGRRRSRARRRTGAAARGRRRRTRW
jgi:N-methylhydantoinase A/oxoprolinase/acetone carboxylase beta subunit